MTRQSSATETWKRNTIALLVHLSGRQRVSEVSPLIVQGVLRAIKAQVDKHLSNPADHSSIVIIYGLLPVTVITTALDDLKHRWWWETKQTAVK